MAPTTSLNTCDVHYLNGICNESITVPGILPVITCNYCVQLFLLHVMSCMCGTAFVMALNELYIIRFFPHMKSKHITIHTRKATVVRLILYRAVFAFRINLTSSISVIFILVYKFIYSKFEQIQRVTSLRHNFLLLLLLQGYLSRHSWDHFQLPIKFFIFLLIRVL